MKNLGQGTLFAHAPHLRRQGLGSQRIGTNDPGEIHIWAKSGRRRRRRRRRSCLHWSAQNQNHRSCRAARLPAATGCLVDPLIFPPPPPPTRRGPPRRAVVASGEPDRRADADGRTDGPTRTRSLTLREGTNDVLDLLKSVRAANDDDDDDQVGRALKVGGGGGERTNER